MGQPKNDGKETPSETLGELAQQALAVVKKARRHSQNLSNDNYYGNKLAELRADAASVFRGLSAQSAGDTSALAELLEAVFAAQTAPKDRVAAAREFTYALRTTWRESKVTVPETATGLFPLTILSETKRGYLVTIGRQMNGCYGGGWYDAAAVMMRRLLEISIIEAFENKSLSAKIQDKSGNYFQLTELIARALAEPVFPLSRNAKKFLPQLRDVGHMSAHGRYFLAQKEDLDKVQAGCRVVIEEFLHHANLLSV